MSGPDGLEAVQRVLRHLAAGGQVRLFLDYDGTLVPIAPTPAEAAPDAPLLELLAGIARQTSVHTTILSGRPLATLQDYLPVPGLTLAGLYGAEVRWPGGRVEYRAEIVEARRTVEQLQAAWGPLVDGLPGVFLEDKGSSLALHARFAAAEAAEAVLLRARVTAVGLGDGFRLLGGHRFLEVVPVVAHKGGAVDWLLERVPLPRAWLLYFGDDDKDEEAFDVVRRHGGLPILVGPAVGPTQALERVDSPEAVRQFLAALASASAQPLPAPGRRPGPTRGELE